MQKRVQPRHRSSTGFARSGSVELLLLIYIVAAVLNLVMGHWIFATAMLMPLAGLVLWTLYLARRDRCSAGDQVRVSMGPHSGKEGVVTGTHEAGTRFTVKLPFTEAADEMDFFDWEIRKVKTTSLPNQSIPLAEPC